MINSGINQTFGQLEGNKKKKFFLLYKIYFKKLKDMEDIYKQEYQCADDEGAKIQRMNRQEKHDNNLDKLFIINNI